MLFCSLQIVLVGGPFFFGVFLERPALRSEVVVFGSYRTTTSTLVLHVVVFSLRFFTTTRRRPKLVPLRFFYHQPYGQSKPAYFQELTIKKIATSARITKMASNSSGNASRVAGLAVAPPVGLEPTTSWLTASAFKGFMPF